jgi:hypothetical protein
VYLGQAYSPEAESAAFQKVHNLAVAIGELKQQGNQYGVNQLLPYFRQAIDAYKAVGNADPANLTTFERLYLQAGEAITPALSFGFNKLVVPVVLGVVALFLLSRKL